MTEHTDLQRTILDEAAKNGGQDIYLSPILGPEKFNVGVGEKTVARGVAASDALDGLAERGLIDFAAHEPNGTLRYFITDAGKAAAKSLED